MKIKKRFKIYLFQQKQIQGIGLYNYIFSLFKPFMKL